MSRVQDDAKVSHRVSQLRSWTVGSSLGWLQMLTDGQMDVQTGGKPDPYIAPCLRQA